MPGNDVLCVEELTVSYEKTSVLWDVHFKIPQGKLIGVIGPNGAGKSTLLKSVMGLLKPMSGEILFFGKPLSQVRQRVAYVPQRSSVDWNFPITAFELVLMGRYGKLGFLKWTSKKDKEAAKKALALVEMEGFAHRQISQLSGGQQQRLFIARSLVQEADFYLMDEPFAGIDIATEKVLIRIFEELRKEGKTILAVHHDLNTASDYFDWMLLLNTCVIAAGPTREVFTPENLARTYGQSSLLLKEAASFIAKKSQGDS
ncbi:MAG: metal ABC transporter ATP-binding protein [Verrucomicrobia bacterium]|nr:metal ABC transporter ATP-binding protein [Verrucomicrobiota bacterium]